MCLFWEKESDCSREFRVAVCSVYVERKNYTERVVSEQTLSSFFRREDEREDDMFHERQDRGERRGGGFDDRDRDGEEISWDRIGPLQPAKGAGGGFRSGGGGFERDGNFDDRPREDGEPQTTDLA